MNPKLFQYAIIWHPTEKQIATDGAKSKLLVDITSTIAKDLQSAQMLAARAIPSDYVAQIDQVEIVCCPF